MNTDRDSKQSTINHISLTMTAADQIQNGLWLAGFTFGKYVFVEYTKHPGNKLNDICIQILGVI